MSKNALAAASQESVTSIASFVTATLVCVAPSERSHETTLLMAASLAPMTPAEEAKEALKEKGIVAPEPVLAEIEAEETLLQKIKSALPFAALVAAFALVTPWTTGSFKRVWGGGPFGAWPMREQIHQDKRPTGFRNSVCSLASRGLCGDGLRFFDTW